MLDAYFLLRESFEIINIQIWVRKKKPKEIFLQPNKKKIQSSNFSFYHNYFADKSLNFCTSAKLIGQKEKENEG